MVERAVIAEDIAAETSLSRTTEPTTVRITCPGCEEEVTVQLGLVVRQMGDEEAELMTLVIHATHQHQHRQDAMAMYVVREV